MKATMDEDDYLAHLSVGGRCSVPVSEDVRTLRSRTPEVPLAAAPRVARGVRLPSATRTLVPQDLVGAEVSVVKLEPPVGRAAGEPECAGRKHALEPSLAALQTEASAPSQGPSLLKRQRLGSQPMPAPAAVAEVRQVLEMACEQSPHGSPAPGLPGSRAASLPSSPRTPSPERSSQPAVLALGKAAVAGKPVPAPATHNGTALLGVEAREARRLGLKSSAPPSAAGATPPCGAVEVRCKEELGPERGPSALASPEEPPPLQGSSRAQLLSLEVKDFKVFECRSFSFEGAGAQCFVGPNSCGKSSILDALRFVLLREGPKQRLAEFVRDFIRGEEPADIPYAACVTARFRCEGIGVVVLRRRARVEGIDSCLSTFVGAAGDDLRQISQQGYADWISQSLLWADGDAAGDLLLAQWNLQEGRSAARLLASVPEALKQAKGGVAAAPMLKRRVGRGPEANGAAAVGRGSVVAEAWLARRVDEIYRELTREPLDSDMEEWGDGGQACLRHLEDGSFALLVSAQRGPAACGYGTAFSALSNGDQDVCALALVLALQGLACGMMGALPPFVLLDEPDSRLDKQHARALWRFLSGPLGPTQCLLLSLNNHQAFEGIAQTMDARGEASTA